MQNLWDACLRRLEQELPAQQFNTWIRPLAPEAGDAARHAGPRRAQSLRARAGARALCRPHRAPRDRGERPRARPAPGARARRRTPPRAAAAPRAARGARSALGARARAAQSGFTFDSFVTGKATSCARRGDAGRREPGHRLQPAVHLRRRRPRQDAPDARGRQPCSPTAARRRASATSTPSSSSPTWCAPTSSKSFDEFKRYYHSLDLLLIDDIQFFAGKDRTQEEFFHAFNALVEAHKQIIITCDTYPKEIAGIEERLISRFGWGLTVAIEPPELEMRVAILLKKAEAEARRAARGRRLLHRQAHPLQRARARRRAEARCSPTRASTAASSRSSSPRRRCSDLLTSQNRQVSVENIQKTVADYYKIKVADMYSKKRSRNVARPRQIAMALAKELTQRACRRSARRSAAATTRRCCMPAARSPACASSDTGAEPRLHVLEQALKG